MIIALFTGCNDKENNDVSDDNSGVVLERSVQELEKIDGFVKSGLEFFFGSTRESIENALGTPIKTKYEEHQNRHDPSKTDVIHELYYEGLYFQIYSVTEYNKDILLVVSLSNDAYPVQFGLNINSSRDKVRAVLGKPDTASDEMYRYFASEYVMGLVEFTFKGNNVTSIRWTFIPN